MSDRQKPIEPLTEPEVDALMKAASRRAPTGIRNRALLAVLYYGGLRLAEALALQPRDLDLDGGCINVRRGKGHKQRFVGLSAAAVAHLDRWLAVRRDRRLASNGEPLFCTLQGNPLDPRYVRQFLSRYAEKAGSEKRVHPHGLRHSHAAHLAKHKPVHIVQRQLGHKSLATTQQYLDAISPAEVVEAVQEAWETREPKDEVEDLRERIARLEAATRASPVR